MPRTPALQLGRNLAAFLDTIALSEGTSVIAHSDDGYNVLVGGGLFASYDKHPLVNGIFLPKLKIYSTAAGRYQLLHRYFDHYAQTLKLSDFSPVSQDRIAVQQIKECGALATITLGDFASSVRLCSRIWASLPGAGYGQHENQLAQLSTFYTTRLTV